MPIVSGGGGGTTSTQVAASGLVLPVANAASVTVDTTTYSDPIAGGGAKLTTLVFPSNAGALAIALSGDTFPRWLIASDATDGLYGGRGNVNPYSGPAAGFYIDSSRRFNITANNAQVTVGSTDTNVGAYVSVGNLLMGGAVLMQSASGAPTKGGSVGDFYWRTDGPPYLYACTTAGGAGVAVWATYTHAAPADASLAAGDLVLWFDQTNGAAKLMVKAKQANGTVVAAAVALA